MGLFVQRECNLTAKLVHILLYFGHDMRDESCKIEQPKKSVSAIYVTLARDISWNLYPEDNERNDDVAKTTK